MHRTQRRRVASVAVVSLLAACSPGTGSVDDPTSQDELFPSASASDAESDGAERDRDGTSQQDESAAAPSEDEATSPSPSPTDTASETPNAEPSDDFAVPDEITEDYIERVLNELNRLSGEISRDILRRDVDPDAIELPDDLDDRVRDVSRGSDLTVSRRTLTALLRETDERKQVLPADEYDQVRYEVEEVLTTEPCVGVRVVQDYTGTDPTPIDPDVTPLAVVFLTRVEGANTTGWKTTDLLLPDAAPDSPEEAAIRQQSIGDILDAVGEVCQ